MIGNTKNIGVKLIHLGLDGKCLFVNTNKGLVYKESYEPLSLKRPIFFFRCTLYFKNQNVKKGYSENSLHASFVVQNFKPS